MKFHLFLVLSVTISFALEVNLEQKDELCMRYTASEQEGSINFDAVSSGFNSKLVIYRIYNEKSETITEQRKLEEFHYILNNTKYNENYKFCIKDMDGTKKNIFFNIFEHSTVQKPLHKDSFEGLRGLLQDLLEKLRSIEQGIRFRETLASSHIELTGSNMRNIKYGSILKIVIVGLITILEILILMKFIEKKDRVSSK